MAIKSPLILWVKNTWGLHECHRQCSINNFMFCSQLAVSVQWHKCKQNCPCAYLWTTASRQIGSGGMAPCILSLCNRWRRMVSLMPKPLYPREMASRCPLVSLKHPTSGLDIGEKKKKNGLSLMGIKPQFILWSFNPHSTLHSIYNTNIKWPNTWINYINK